MAERLKKDAESVKPEEVDDPDVKEKLAKLKVEEQKVLEEESKVKKKERLMPWNVDTLSKDGFAKTLINRGKPRVDTSKMSEEEKEEYYKNFVSENEKDMKHFGMLSKWDDCKAYLIEKPNLVCEETANYLAIWCLNLAMEDKFELMEHVSKQVISMQYILELAKQLDRDPRSCVPSFFTRIQTAEPEYLAAFEDELVSFKQRIRNRAKEKVEAIMQEIEEEEKQKRLGPGGLDPVEVFECLPKEMQECFESRDLSKLQEVIANMNEEDAKYHMKRCVDSGLWVPDASSPLAAEGRAGDKSDDQEKKSGDEPVYAEPTSTA